MTMDDDLGSEIDNLLSKEKERQGAATEGARRMTERREKFIQEFLQTWESTIRPGMEAVRDRLSEHGVECEIDGPGDRKERGPRYENEVAIRIHGPNIISDLSFCPEQSMDVTVDRSSPDGRRIAHKVKVEAITPSFVDDALRQLLRAIYRGGDPATKATPLGVNLWLPLLAVVVALLVAGAAAYLFAR